MAFDIEYWVYETFEDVKQYGDTDLRVNCPFCEERGHGVDTSHHLHISIVKPACHCFKCDYGYMNWTSLVADIEGITYGQAKRKQYESVTPLYKLLRRRAYDVDSEDALLYMPEGFVTIADGTSLNVPAAFKCMEYVQRRLSRHVRDWQAYLDEWGMWRDGSSTIVLPVERGWYQERHILKRSAGPKYLSTPHDREDRLYNYGALTRYGRVHVAEGIFSAACIGRDAIAMCGKTANDKQVERMCSSAVETFVICLDAGFIVESLRLAEALHARGKRVVVRMYEYGDPASCKVYAEQDFSFALHVALMLGIM